MNSRYGHFGRSQRVTVGFVEVESEQYLDVIAFVEIYSGARGLGCTTPVNRCLNTALGVDSIIGIFRGIDHLPSAQAKIRSKNGEEVDRTAHR